jgi:hypothetical protein
MLYLVKREIPCDVLSGIEGLWVTPYQNMSGLLADQRNIG